ncbi:MAG TPA: mersacidin/lichenicidin family type 2 lantibiotic [Blastocatellia bacterium]|nr:mersacidin/lichenicidin family type 2 lantibiotic [Blastocatellia bacterium]
MSRLDVVRAWKDEEYRIGLSDEERGLLPENPAGTLDLPEIGGGANVEAITIFRTCDGICTGDFAPCSWGGCPSGDFIPCSFWGCPTQGPWLCIPLEV